MHLTVTTPFLRSPNEQPFRCCVACSSTNTSPAMSGAAADASAEVGQLQKQQLSPAAGTSSSWPTMNSSSTDYNAPEV